MNSIPLILVAEKWAINCPVGVVQSSDWLSLQSTGDLISPMAGLTPGGILLIFLFVLKNIFIYCTGISEQSIQRDARDEDLTV